MSHELLNNLWGNSFFKASTAERMSQRMWTCQVWDKKNISFFLPDST